MTPAHRFDRASADPSALARVVGDGDVFRDAWGLRPWLHHGPGYDDLLNLQGIDELLTTRGLRTPFLRVAKNGTTMPERSFTAGGGVGAAVADQLSDARLADLFADGATLVLQGLHRTWAPIMTFTADLADQLGHPVQANAYVTPPQSQGFSAHYDVHDVFVLQLSGEKRWVVHEPVLTWPTREETWETGGRRDQVADGARREPVLDVVLAPGDCLYLPRGYVHSAQALGGVSAHLTLGVHVWTRAHLADAITRRALATATELRRPLDLGVHLGDAGEISADAAVVRQALVAAIERTSDADIAALMDRRADDSARPEPIAPLAQAEAERNLSPDTRLRARSHLRLRRVVEGRGIRLRGRGIDLLVETPDSCRLQLRLDLLLDGEAHTTRELAGGTADDLLELARTLLRAGVLIPA